MSGLRSAISFAFASAILSILLTSSAVQGQGIEGARGRLTAIPPEEVQAILSRLRPAQAPGPPLQPISAPPRGTPGQLPGQPIPPQAPPIGSGTIWNTPAPPVPSAPPLPNARGTIWGTQSTSPAPAPRAQPTQPVAPPRALPPPRPPMQAPPAAAAQGRSVRDFLARCDRLSRRGLEYKFGNTNPSSGGLDCSGTVVWLLKQMGISSVPRTAYDQYLWLQEHGMLQKVRRNASPAQTLASLRPGQLIFWSGTYSTSRPVSHVMIYMGNNGRGTHYIFGAKGTRARGVNGYSVDVFEFTMPSSRSKTPVVGFGNIPGLAYQY